MKFTILLRTGILAMALLPLSPPESSATDPANTTSKPTATEPAESRVIVDENVEAAAYTRRNRRTNARSGYSSGGMNQALPGGRRYYGGRYFGNFNNRYYGPQYGYF